MMNLFHVSTAELFSRVSKHFLVRPIDLNLKSLFISVNLLLDDLKNVYKPVLKNANYISFSPFFKKQEKLEKLFSD